MTFLILVCDNGYIVEYSRSNLSKKYLSFKYTFEQRFKKLTKKNMAKQVGGRKDLLRNLESRDFVQNFQRSSLMVTYPIK